MTVISLAPPQCAPHASEVDVLKGNWIENYDGTHVSIARFSGCENRRLGHGKTQQALWCRIGSNITADVCRHFDPFGRAQSTSVDDDVDDVSQSGFIMVVAYDRTGKNFYLVADARECGRIKYRINEAGHLQIHYRDPASAYADAQPRPMGRFRRNYRLDVDRLNFERMPKDCMLVFRYGEVEVQRILQAGSAGADVRLDTDIGRIIEQYV
ncbi:hypothetical protein G3N95_37015 [Paraburkholderia sp. Tr-20389]|uniref:hypothetical protein n=1 Tax=Paraburkholderia sp. Tr-20389 TaxID=2703903 RepID=UPI0019802E5A|nr:hypothetical protein [Paraburkholderia sp. Tr-20389]MBN3758561.1 hypothetical protein [Paraburkholderia sp. Tr-20389]